MRIMNPRLIRAVATAAALSFTVAACSPGPSQPAPAAPAAPTQAEADAIAAGTLSALAPANLAKVRPKAPFDVTSNWFIDVSQDPKAWHFFLPPYPKLTAAAQKEFDASKKYEAEGKVYKDDIGQCWPAGLPLIMTRYWPMAMVQIPTAVYMVSGFFNSFRTIFLDGREHTASDVAINTPNGESVGHWEGDTLVVDTRYFVDDHHWMDQGGRSIPAGDQLHIVERIRLIKDVDQLEIAYTMTDPEHWEGEWKSTKRFNRVNDVDVGEVACTPDLNAHVKSTQSKAYVK